MWSQFPLRLCMAAMAPALTDAAAHTGSFKLPASPANPGSSGGLQANPHQPTSPDLPSLANGHSPAVPDIIGKCYSPSPTTRLRNHEDSPSPTCFTIHTHFLENNNHKERETVTRITEEQSYQGLLSSNHCQGPIKNKLNSLISTIGSSLDLDLVTNGERHSTKQSIQKTMNDSAASLAQKEVLNDIHPSTSSASKMPPLTISATGSSSPTGTKHSVAAHIDNVNIRDNGDVSEHGELDTSDTSSSSLSNDMDSSLSLSLSTALTTDTSLEQVNDDHVDDPLDAKSDDESDSDESIVEHPAISREHHGTCHKIEQKEREILDPVPDKQKEEIKCSRQVPVKQLNQKKLFKVVISNGQATDEEKKEVTSLVHKQSKQEHRAKYLMEKLRRLQTCHVGSRIYHQIGSFVESKQSSKEAANSAASSTVTCEECRRNRLQTGSRPGVLPRSSSSHSHTCPLHTNSSSDRQRHTVRPSWLPAGKRTKPSTHISQHLREGKQAYREVKSVTGRLRAGLGHVESAIDSDVTDSSSGGESCDEGDDSLPQSQASRSFHKMPLHRRASWKWAMDRSAIATRWTWLQAQVSDLEYRIRQQSDIFRQIRATKGAVTLGEPPSPEEYLRAQALAHRSGRKLSPLETKIVMLEGSHSMSPSNLSSLLSNVDKQSAKLKQSLQNCISPVSTSSTCQDKTSPARPMNGLTDNATTVATPSSRCGMNSSPSYPGIVGLDQVTGSPIPVEEQYCARTRPVRQFRKRKLIRSTGLYQVCRKAQKLSTVQCGCFPPHTPCVMCGGRFNNVEQYDADQIPSDERVASLEYAFHSVLSFPEEIPLTLHFESLLKSGAWQRKHSARSLGKKKHNRLPNRSRVKLHTKDGRLKKFRKKEKHHQQKQLAARSSGDSTRKREPYSKKEAKERSAPPVDDEVEKEEGSANEEEDDAAKSRKLLHRLARQKLKALRHVRSDKLLSRSRSQPSSVPGTPKNIMKSSDLRQCRTDIKNRRTSDLANAALEKSRERSMSLPNIEVGDHTSAPSTPASIEARSPTQHLSHSLPSASLHGILRNKKGMVESYDIDNIVIPYSMLASTRVVKLNYKEIVTPKWRELDMEEFMSNNHHAHHENEGSRLEDEDEDEDEYFEEILSDSEFLERHEPCECMEKQKFMVSFVDHGIPGRRSRRSRNSSIGSVTDPLSPDLHLDQLSTGRQSSTSSPTPSPSPITTPDQLSSSTSSNVFNLSGSRSLRFSALNRRRSSSMSEVQTPKQPEAPVPLNNLTWVKRQFPLNNNEMEEIATYPYPESEPSTRPSSRASNATHSESVISRTESQEMNLYMSDGENSEGEPMEVDDPNDPEWTVVEDQQRSRKLEGSTMSESLVLKLAKR